MIRTDMSVKEDFSDLYARMPISVAEKYPDVPAPDPPLSPDILAARWRSHDLYGEDMPRIAADLLEAGHDTPSLRRLAGEVNVRSSSEVEPLVQRVFNELGVHFPNTQDKANLIASRQIAREVISGIRNAWAAANHIEIAVWGWEPRHPILEPIFEINDEIDWLPQYRRSLESLETALLDSFASLARLTDQELDR
jgi:hypothetical protein